MDRDNNKRAVNGERQNNLGNILMKRLSWDVPVAPGTRLSCSRWALVIECGIQAYEWSCTVAEQEESHRLQEPAPKAAECEVLRTRRWPSRQ